MAREYKKVPEECAYCKKPVDDERVAVINYVDIGRVYVHAEKCRTAFANKRWADRHEKIKSRLIE